jgi:hypothetical protein
VPSQVFSHETTTDASVDAVWAKLDQPETWESIGGVDRVFDPKIDDQGRLHGFSFDTIAAGRKYVGTATSQDRVEGRRIAWRIENPAIRGVTTVELRSKDGRTSITVLLQVQSASLLSSMFFPVIAGAIGSGLPEAVEDFAAALGR